MADAMNAIVAAGSGAGAVGGLPASPFPMKITEFDPSCLKAFNVSAYEAGTGKYIAFGAAVRGAAPVFQLGELRPSGPDDEFTATSDVWLGFPCVKPLQKQDKTYALGANDKMLLPLEFESAAIVNGLQSLRMTAADAVWDQKDKIDPAGAADSHANALEAAAGDEKTAANIHRFNIAAWVAPICAPRTFKDKTYFELASKIGGWASSVQNVRSSRGKESGKPYLSSVDYKLRPWTSPASSFYPPLGPDDCIFEMLIGFKDGVPQTVKRVPSGAGWRALTPADIPPRAPLQVYFKQPKIHFSGAHTGSLQFPAVRVVFARKTRAVGPVARIFAGADTLGDEETANFFAQPGTAALYGLPPAFPVLTLQDKESETVDGVLARPSPRRAAASALFSPASHALPPAPTGPLKRSAAAAFDYDEDNYDAEAELKAPKRG